MNHLGLALLIFTTTGIAHMGAFLFGILLTARRNHMPLIADAMCGATWFATGHVVAVVPFTLRVIQNESMQTSFDAFFFATRLIFVCGILRMLEPCRIHWAIPQEIYYPTVVGVYGSIMAIVLGVVNGKGLL
jgi:hypothetical protein